MNASGPRAADFINSPSRERSILDPGGDGAEKLAAKILPLIGRALNYALILAATAPVSSLFRADRIPILDEETGQSKSPRNLPSLTP